MSDKNLKKSIMEGKFILGGIQEEDMLIAFTPPLTVTYSISEEINEDDETKKELVAKSTYDFGMSMSTSLGSSNMLLDGYNGLNRDSEPQDILMATINYDIFHAFCHYEDNSSYSYYHWAIIGHLQDRATVITKVKVD